MTADWLTFQSFRQSQEVLRWINTVTIHLALTVAGIADKDRRQAAVESAKRLVAFLTEVETACAHADSGQAPLTLAIDPRVQRLADGYLAARRDHRFASRLLTDPFSSIRALFESSSRSDQEALVECLAELRVLVEELMHDETDEILGGI
jgi:hypothetical protein